MSTIPGVMIYFDVLKMLRRLSLEEGGHLFIAVLEYGQYAKLPDFEDNQVLALCWDFIQMRIDLDQINYQKKCEANRRAAQKRWQDKTELPSDANACQTCQL